jgi:DNA polymerase-3 subunit chi
LLALETELDALGPAPLPAHEWLINLRLVRSAHFAAFDRVAEIICQDDAVREAGRAHYRFYRERGYPLHHHELKGREA